MVFAERTVDKHGQILLAPDIEVNTWWTNLGWTDDEIIASYHAHGESEQYHSEIKTDMDVERLPSGKFATNELVLELTIIAYNLLRMIGQESLKHKPEAQARSYMKQLLPKLDYWKRYEELSDGGQFEAFKERLIEEINALHIEGMPKVEKLNALIGSYVNLAYRLPSGLSVKFLDDQTTYLGNQLESEFGGERCFGILANMEFILICTYESGRENPELLLYKKR